MWSAPRRRRQGPTEPRRILLSWQRPCQEQRPARGFVESLTDAEREILDATEAFLQNNDFRDLTVDGVMAATGMKRSAFYNYFADRNVLILRLLQDIEAEMMQAISPWLERSGDPETALRTGLEQVAQIYGLHGHLLRAIHEASFHDDEVERAYRQVVDDFVEWWLRCCAGRTGRAGRRSPALERWLRRY